jgi:hypothetical protein
MTRFVIGTALSVTFMMTAGCSGSSPSSPSSSFQAQSFSAGGASSIALSSHDHGSNGLEEHHGNGREEQLEGAIASIDAAHKSFVVRGTTVSVLPETIIRHGHTSLTFADLVVGTRVHVKGSAGDGTAVTAREVKVQREDGDRDEDEAEGVVSGLTGTCPAITFNVGTRKVTASATTVFGHGGCAAVANGEEVEVKGTVQSDGSLAASRISADHEGDDADD